MKIHLIDSTQKLYDAIGKSLKEMDLSATVSVTHDEAVASIQKQSPGIVIINMSKELTDTEDLCRKIRKIKTEGYVYILLISPREREKEVASLIKSGANDYIFKPLSKDDLSMRVMIAQRTLKLEDSASKSKKKLIRFAKEDPHTGLLNRRALLDEALKEMGRASREKKNFSAIMIGTTNFKKIVSTYGNETADEVLLELSRRLKAICRPYDVAGRYTVTDFMVFLPDTGSKNAQKVAKRILSAMTEKPFVVKGRKMNIMLGIGLSDLSYQNVVDNNTIDAHMRNDLLLDSLVKRSETAMEKAGKAGRNSIVINA
ncbi:MAG TPA: diguanylate cyclase [Spirochaetota bacterium]|nr:diguanylate cyclase [Spirochaetota bacterium]HRZ26107.1 diguanylate cyclase [Spirochaetota bacterium]HSA13444.1 diguanylate cyclase [Spirochaetota bacterium]